MARRKAMSADERLSNMEALLIEEVLSVYNNIFLLDTGCTTHYERD